MEAEQTSTEHSFTYLLGQQHQSLFNVEQQSSRTQQLRYAKVVDV